MGGVALSGDLLMVGGAYSPGGGDRVSVGFVFARSGTAWTEQDRLVAADPDYAGGFGSALALGSDYAAIGAPEADYPDGSSHDEGAVYVFDLLPDPATGEACLSAAECSTGFCVDGVCCDRACDGPCEACSQVRKADRSDDGTCGPMAEGARCGDGGGCASRSEARLASICDAAGACVEQAETCPDGLACVDATGACAISCAVGGIDVHEMCADAYHCLDGVCVDDLPIASRCSDSQQCRSDWCLSGRCLGLVGETCTGPVQCLSGYCADGVCCDSACTGQCEACQIGDADAEAGTCRPVTGDPLGTRPSCSGGDDPADAACAGSCDGSRRDSCVYPRAATVCGPAVCSGDVLELARGCDGAGWCGLAATQSCAPYGCDADPGECRITCTVDADCSEGAVCNSLTGRCTLGQAACLDASMVLLPDGTQLTCAPYRRELGACTDSCVAESDCAPGAECVAGTCTASTGEGGAGGGGGTESTGDAGAAGAAPAASPGADDDDGCGCRIVRSGSGANVGWLLLFAVGAAHRRRRRAH